MRRERCPEHGDRPGPPVGPSLAACWGALSASSEAGSEVRWQGAWEDWVSVGLAGLVIGAAVIDRFTTSRRRLTASETGYLRIIFAESVDYQRVTITRVSGSVIACSVGQITALKC
jgi:hypothetical protein